MSKACTMPAPTAASSRTVDAGTAAAGPARLPRRLTGAPGRARRAAAGLRAGAWAGGTLAHPGPAAIAPAPRIGPPGRPRTAALGGGSVPVRDLASAIRNQPPAEHDWDALHMPGAVQSYGVL